MTAQKSGIAMTAKGGDTYLWLRFQSIFFVMIGESFYYLLLVVRADSQKLLAHLRLHQDLPHFLRFSVNVLSHESQLL